MVRRPLANRAVFRVKEKLARTLPEMNWGGGGGGNDTP